MMQTAADGLIAERGQRRLLTKLSKRLLQKSPFLRNVAIFTLSIGCHPRNSSGWIRFLMYHQVKNENRRGFERQIDYMRTFGEFISIDEAVSILKRGDPVDGRYLCVTLDDGFKDGYTNAFPILSEKGVPAIFYVVPEFIAYGVRVLVDRSRKKNDSSLIEEYLSWDNCRVMAEHGMTIGSHGYSHANLLELDADLVAEELRTSKEHIEREVGRACRHFACPFGQPNHGFLPKRDPNIARSVGYTSFATTVRGKAFPGDSPFYLPRDQVDPANGLYCIRYYCS